MRKETIEEFLKRGGVVNKIPAQAIPETAIPIKTSAASADQIMSLDEGAHFFAENRKTNKAAKQQILIKDVIDGFNLPKEIVDRLRGVNVSK